MPVPADSDDQLHLKELQSALDRVRVFAEENVQKVGSPEFPLFQRTLIRPAERSSAPEC
jgi:hypothetical protein